MACAPLFSLPAVTQDAAVGRVLAVGKVSGLSAEVELDVVTGSHFNNSDVELFTPRSRMAATLRTGPTIDMLMRGDKVKVT